MCNGDVQQYDTPQNIFTNPVNKFVGYFVGTPGMNFIDCSCDEKEDHVCLVSSCITCEVPEDVEEKLRGHSSKDVILGIRGEDIQVGKTGPNCLEAEVVAKERWGNRNVVTLQAGEYTISAKFSLDTEIIIGQKIWIQMPPEKIRVFDRKTEKCIY
jgi:multiple sugar transport system ATP-binding protein